MLNKVILIGNLGADPELKYMPSGDAVVNLSVATSETWKDKQTGEKQTKTEWHRVSFFGRTAEVCGNYLKKGSKVYIEGQIETRKYEKDGQTRYSTDIKGRQMQMLDSKSDGGFQQQAAPVAQADGGFNDDKIPF